MRAQRREDVVAARGNGKVRIGNAQVRIQVTRFKLQGSRQTNTARAPFHVLIHLPLRYRASSKLSSQAGRYTAISVTAMPVMNASPQPISRTT